MSHPTRTVTTSTVRLTVSATVSPPRHTSLGKPGSGAPRERYSGHRNLCQGDGPTSCSRWAFPVVPSCQHVTGGPAPSMRMPKKRTASASYTTSRWAAARSVRRSVSVDGISRVPGTRPPSTPNRWCGTPPLADVSLVAAQQHPVDHVEVAYLGVDPAASVREGPNSVVGSIAISCLRCCSWSTIAATPARRSRPAGCRPRAGGSSPSDRCRSFRASCGSGGRVAGAPEVHDGGRTRPLNPHTRRSGAGSDGWAILDSNQ